MKFVSSTVVTYSAVTRINWLYILERKISTVALLLLYQYAFNTRLTQEPYHLLVVG